MLHICDLLYNSGSEKVQQMDCTSLILVTSLYNEAYSLITFSLFSCKISSHFNVHGSMHRKNILIYMQQDATLHSLFYLETALHVSVGTSTSRNMQSSFQIK